MSVKFLAFFHEGKLPDGRTILRGTLGNVRVAVAQDIRPGSWMFYAEETKAKRNGYKVEMLDGGCTLLTPRWPKKKKRKAAQPMRPRATRRERNRPRHAWRSDPRKRTLVDLLPRLLSRA